jgi:hypothetical protein
LQADPFQPPASSVPLGEIACHEFLGGVLKRYEGKAAYGGPQRDRGLSIPLHGLA